MLPGFKSSECGEFTGGNVVDMIETRLLLLKNNIIHIKLYKVQRHTVKYPCAKELLKTLTVCVCVFNISCATVDKNVIYKISYVITLKLRI